nr:MAG: putative RNA-dependent RNA polymerase [Sanya botourmia-like virus 3]
MASQEEGSRAFQLVGVRISRSQEKIWIRWFTLLFLNESVGFMSLTSRAVMRRRDSLAAHCPFIPTRAPRDDSVVRVGIAKTKGKFRTVTMQSARVKRVLKPVHSALYDHLSSFGWLVRGDVNLKDYQAVIEDLRDGEKIISGDYTAATDNIYLEAVTAIVEVLSECPELSEEERKVLVGSFTNLRWESSSGKQHPILRGSMMGNLVSFPLLCLLNKACFDISTDLFYGSGTRRVGRFNGDDCLFPGCPRFFRLWREVTGTFGLKVNESKTGISAFWADLNSQPFCRGKRGLNPKPVLSFLRPFRQESDDLVSEVYQGIKTFSRDVQAYVWNVLMRHEISLREINLSQIPNRTRRFLFRQSWFRRALQIGPAKVLERGTKRSPDVVLGNPPKPDLYDMVSWENDSALRRHVNAWTGVSFGEYSVYPPQPHPVTGVPVQQKDWRPYERRIDRKEFYERTKGIPTDPPRWILKVRTRFQFLWPRSVYERFLSRGWLISDDECESEWIEDHPLLTVKTEIYRSSETRFHPSPQGLFAPPSQFFPLATGGVRLPVGYGRPEKLRKPRFVPRRLGDFNPLKMRPLLALLQAGS